MTLENSHYLILLSHNRLILILVTIINAVKHHFSIPQEFYFAAKAKNYCFLIFKGFFFLNMSDKNFQESKNLDFYSNAGFLRIPFVPHYIS